MKTLVSTIVLLGPLVVLLLDWFVFQWVGYDATITGIVRYWHSHSPWPEFIYVLGVVVLYLHLFRNWP